jgi:hypothetical protein
MSKYGYDMNGEEITESTIEELTRIVADELLPKTELAKIFGKDNVYMCPDIITYYATGTAFGADVRYTIGVYINNTIFDLTPFENPVYAGIRPTNKEIRFSAFINVENDTAAASICTLVDEINIEDDYTDFFATRFEALYDTAKLVKYLEEIAEKDLYNIRAIISNI